MALTKTFPTGDLAGLSIVDTRRVIGSLIVCDTSGNPRLGVLPRNTSPIVTSTASLNYAVAGADFVTSRTGAGAELLSNDGTTNVLTTAAPASNARTDVVWVRPQFTASADASNTPVFGVTQGVTSGTVPPPEPAIPAGALKLATVYFPSGATATNSAGVVITQVYPFTATAGGTPLFRSTKELNDWTTAAPGQLAEIIGTPGLWSFVAGTPGYWVPLSTIVSKYAIGQNVATSAAAAVTATPVPVGAETSVLSDQLFTRVSGGFNIIRAGEYEIGGPLTLNIAGTLQKLNQRIFIDIVVTGIPNQRIAVYGAPNEDSIVTPSTKLRLPAGAQLRFNFFHSNGSTVTFAWLPFLTWLGPLV